MDNTIEHIETTGNDRQISIWLDSYDDIFSDFDHRPYAERMLSDDFIAEMKRVSREEEYDIGELRLFMPPKNRKQEPEATIIKRVHAYFRKGNYSLLRRIKITQSRGILLVLTGMLMMLLASYISTIHSDLFYMKILFVLFEPAGWFFVWTGMDNLFFATGKRKEDLNFFSKMIKTKVVFASI